MLRSAADSDQMGLDWDLAGGFTRLGDGVLPKGDHQRKGHRRTEAELRGDAGVVLELMRKISLQGGLSGTSSQEGSARAADVIGREQQLLRVAY